MIHGYCKIWSELSLENLGAILSERVFCKIPFGGREEDIHEEVPAIFIQQPFLVC